MVRLTQVVSGSKIKNKYNNSHQMEEKEMNEDNVREKAESKETNSALKSKKK